MIVITGATGHTGRPAAEALLARGEKVRVVGRDAHKLEPLAQRGAEVFAGEPSDAAAMTKALTGADVVYLVVPQAHVDDMRAFQETVTGAYAAAVAAAKPRHVVALSSIGAQHPEKTGPIVGLHNMEQKLNEIAGLNVLYLRPTQFMENLLMNIAPLRMMGSLPGAAPGDVPHQWIATRDIGAYAAKRLAARDFSGSSVQELFGPRDVTWKEIASMMGAAIGKPGMGYMQVPFIMLEPALAQIGMSKKMAALMVEMLKAANAGMLNPTQPRTAENTTPTTMEWFIKEVFAPAYSAKAGTA
ncbi:MAG TPA: NmrA family NAD(P)-binding protein [Candidatus Limnocylindrales bacterium]|nr:NmrA family NAD(P)-binding protein [Candidatus Limnocylindrales bacterium]